MKKDKWEEEWKFKEKIKKLIRDNANPPHKFPRVGHRLEESQVEDVAIAFIAFLDKDRKRQRAEMLKRLPSADEIMREIPVTFDAAELVLGYIKKKLEGIK